MTTQFKPKDHKARQKISECLDETLFVEASAGTGKTTSLVQRVVNLVASARATIGSIAAITFTEAAAAELRDRARQELEKAANDQSRSEIERFRCRQAADGLGQAYFQTLHSFASALLHERPLEAGLPPGFETTDAIAAELRFDAAWNDWLRSQLEGDTDIAPQLTMALALGMTVKNLRDVAKAFHLNYDALQGVEFKDAPPDCEYATQPHRQAVATLLNGLQVLIEFCEKPEAKDRLHTYIDEKLQESRPLAGEDLESLEVCRRISEILPFKPGRGGSQPNWSITPKEVRDHLKEIESAVRSVALPPILRELQKFVLDYARTRRETDGRAEFQDLLVWTHELLRDNIEVRDHFCRRFTHLLIDESQDTDPIQAEIAMFLAEAVDADAEPGHRPRDWDKITPEKGKLFVVGDPKQSIYRFPPRRREPDVPTAGPNGWRRSEGGADAEFPLSGTCHRVGEFPLREVAG